MKAILNYPKDKLGNCFVLMTVRQFGTWNLPI